MKVIKVINVIKVIKVINVINVIKVTKSRSSGEISPRICDSSYCSSSVTSVLCPLACVISTVRCSKQTVKQR